MTERPDQRDPYYQHDFQVELTSLDPRLGLGVRFKAHQSAERFVRGGRNDELVPLSVPRGSRTYFHGKPYLLQPDYRLTIALHPAPLPNGELGVVADSRWEGLRSTEIGNAQGWYYPEDDTLILWECFLDQRYRAGDPGNDSLHCTVWETWEQWLVDRSPGVRRVVTTWEDIYERSTWMAFLER